MRKLLLVAILISWNSVIGAANLTKTYELDNGLRIIVREDHRAPVVVSQVWYKIGSAKEPLGLTGISHALEHMMFQGTPKYPDDQFLKRVHRAGGELNASTTEDWTNYYEVLSKDQLALSFELEADRMQSLSLKAPHFTKELQVVIEERRLRVDDVPSELMQERFFASALMASPYQNPVIGWRDDLDHMTVSDLQKWYDAWYAPNNAVLVVVGDVEPAAVYKLANQIFGAIPKKPQPEVKPAITLPSFDEKRVQAHVPAQVPVVILGYQVPTYANASEPKEVAALIMAGMILDGGSSSRLTKNLIRSTQIAATVDTHYNHLMQHPHLFLLMASPTPGHGNADLEAALKAEVASLQSTLVSSEELDRAKTQWKAQQIYSADSMMVQALKIGLWEVNNLSWEIEGKLNTLIANVSAADIQAVAQKYLIPTRLTVGELLPERPLPQHSEQAS